MVDVHGDEIALMDCPFCGSDTVDIEDARAPDEGLFVCCGLCQAQGPPCESRFNAAMLWNDRTSPTQHCEQR